MYVGSCRDLWLQGRDACESDGCDEAWTTHGQGARNGGAVGAPFSLKAGL